MLFLFSSSSLAVRWTRPGVRRSAGRSAKMENDVRSPRIRESASGERRCPPGMLDRSSDSTRRPRRADAFGTSHGRSWGRL
ncbi:hypothetical protein HMPREF0043_00237 [Actinobaculum sp. oral taxon 183 str. F0552]|nr:hypothetical protein HMPREF0043_00237 [Actinobaculum sp. oral taxon 183 str. F0552]